MPRAPGARAHGGGIAPAQGCPIRQHLPTPPQAAPLLPTGPTLPHGEFLGAGPRDQARLAPGNPPQHPHPGSLQAASPQEGPQSRPLSLSYRSMLPTSLTYIILESRGCSPWRPDAD